MDIVAWLDNLQTELQEAGQVRLADLIDRIPNLTHDNKWGQVEALLPEAISGARALKNPWLEVYFRHWEMRNRIGNLGEGETALAEVVSLLEFAHREENKGCPQAVCTTHDISGCYANLDGPGWARERMEVCAETLDRLDPSWPCYCCLNREYADALVDLGDFDGALKRLETLERTLREQGEEEDNRLLLDRLYIYKVQGDYRTALELLEKADRFDDFISQSEANRIYRGIARAELLAVLGRAEEGFECLPAWSELSPGDYRRWAFAVGALAEKIPESNHWQLGMLLEQAMAHADSVGAHYYAIDIAEVHARLALSRGSRWTARRALRMCQKHAALLRYPEGAASRIERLKSLLQKTKPSPLPVPADHLVDWLGEADERDPEQEAEWLLAALEDVPGDPALTVQAASALEACRAIDEAAGVYISSMDHNEADRGVLTYRLLSLYLDSGKETEALDLAASIEKADPGLSHWARARVAENRGNWNSVLIESDAALEHFPENLPLLRMKILALRECKKFDEAVDIGKILLSLTRKNGEDPVNAIWELIVSASAAEDWKTVREMGELADIHFETQEGPVEEDWGWIRLRFYDDGDWNEYYGIRTGPATARVLSIALPGEVQHVKDVVVFDPSYIEPVPEDEEEREAYVVPHNVVHILSSGGYTSWMCDGADPGDEAFEAFCQALEERRYAVRVRQRDGYRIIDPDADEQAASAETGDQDATLQGIYFAVASPPGVTPGEVFDLLTSQTRDWPHPLCFLRLAQAAGADSAAHEAIIQKYGL